MTVNLFVIQGLKNCLKSNMGFLDLATNLIFPPRCANCGELISMDIRKKHVDPLCPTCRMHYENEKQIELFPGEWYADGRKCLVIPEKEEPHG